ncbi:hypothetical protein LguiA_034448 [Lonicera macranthoides]
MCRGFQQNERARLLNIKSFYLQLSIPKTTQKHLPDSLTLYYLPRINGSPLEINDSKIRSDSPAFVTLHRLVFASNGAVIFGSREKVRASEGVRFDVYLMDDKLLKGIFRKDEGADTWRMECACGIESDAVAAEVRSAEVAVAAEGGVEMREKVEMVVRRKRRCFRGMEEIPEVESEGESDGYSCCCNCGEVEMDGGDCEEEVDREVEGVKWAVDVGIWVMCLGVGYLVSKASTKTFTRRRRIL